MTRIGIGIALAGLLGLPCRAAIPAFDVDVAPAQTVRLSQGSGHKPGVQAFFDSMAIAVKPGQQRRFVVGDNLAGYFEGTTQSYKQGAGYLMKTQALFQDYASFTQGQLNDRTRSSEQILPYGRRVSYANGSVEEMALLSRKYAVAMSVTSKAPAVLAVSPFITYALDAVHVRKIGNAVVLAPLAPTANAAYPQYVAFSADQDFNFSADDGALMVKSRQPVAALTVVAAFGDSPEQAAANAQALAQTDPLRAEKQARYEVLTTSFLATDDLAYNQALNWAKAASLLFVVEEFGKGIWAGLPWFRDNWGRDTFIALPGTLLVTGQFNDARAVLVNFARYQNLRLPKDREYGRIPNRVAAGDSIIYNTVDGTPWMLREALEYIRYTGDKAFAAQMYQLALPYFEGAIANYVDPQSLLTHDDADTWMDARIEGKQPWSARGPRAVEIQALWYSALQSGEFLARQAGDEAKAKEWAAIAQATKTNFLRLFWDGTTMADRLRADATRDTKVRPNQLMLITIPFDNFVPAEVQASVLKNAVSELLYPYGIASLSQNDPYFHPHHVNDQYHHKDAAYHQGTVWGWNAGFTVSALNKFGYQDLAYTLAKNLGEQMLQLGTIGNMSELLDALPSADGSPKPSGTFAQSWSVAEYARNGYQDFVGFRPDLLQNTLAFSPAIPSAWQHFQAVLPYGVGEQLDVQFQRTGDGQRWTFRLTGGVSRTVRFNFLNADKSRSQVSFGLTPAVPTVLQLRGDMLTVDGRAMRSARMQASFASTIGPLRFQTPKPYRPEDFPMLKDANVLKAIIERHDYR